MRTLTLILGMVAPLLLPGCREAGSGRPVPAVPPPTPVSSLWQRSFELFPAAQRSVALLSPCRIWLIAGNAMEWSCSGDSLRTLPEGEGPGEFRYPWLVSNWPGDSIAVWDANLARLSVLDSAGKFGRSQPLPVLMNQGRRISGVYWHSGELHLWTDPFPVAFGDSISDQRAHIWAVPAGAGPLSDSLVSFDGPVSTVMHDATTFSRVDAPLRRRPLVAVLADGTTLVGSTGSDTVMVHAWNGAVLDTLVLGLPAEAASSDDRAKYADSIRESFHSELSAQHLGPALDSFFLQRAEDIIKAADWPATRQRMDLLIAGDSTSFWILRPGFGPERAREWRVYDRKGALQRVLRVPHWGSVAAAAVQGDTLTTVEFRFGADSTALARYAIEH